MSYSKYFCELSTIIERIPSHLEKHAQFLQIQKNIESGDLAERYVYELLVQTYPQAAILTDIYIDNTQIDCLLLTNSFCLLLEVKNIKGNVHITASPRQMLRDDTIFQSPEAQLDRAKHSVTTFFAKHQIKLPIYAAVSFPYHNAKIINESKQYPILMGRDLLYFITTIPHQPTAIDYHQIAQLIQENSLRDYRPKPLTVRYNIASDLIKTGVICPNCQHLPMERHAWKWVCPACKRVSRNAHEQALQQYALLFGDRITNNECRKFLHLNSRHEATRILKTCSHSRHGNTHQSYYKLKY